MESKQSLVEESLVHKTSERTKMHFQSNFNQMEKRMTAREDQIQLLDQKVEQNVNDLASQASALKKTVNMVGQGGGAGGGGGITRAEGKRIKEELQRMANEVKVVQGEMKEA